MQFEYTGSVVRTDNDDWPEAVYDTFGEYTRPSWWALDAIIDAIECSILGGVGTKYNFKATGHDNKMTVEIESE